MTRSGPVIGPIAESLEVRRLFTLILTGTSGNDTYTITGTGDDIVVNGTPHSNVSDLFITLGGGNDTVTIADTVTVPALIRGENGSDTITSGGGDDTLVGGDSDDTLTAGSGDDSLEGNAGNDSLVGGGGRDSFIGGGGGDVFDGGSGSADYADYSTAAVAVSITFDNVANDGPAGEGDNVKTAIEKVKTGTGADTINASAMTVAMNLDGGDGNDTITGGSGADNLFGAGGNDSLIGGTGSDSVFGGTGTDLYSMADGVADAIFVGVGDSGTADGGGLDDFFDDPTD